MFDMSWGEVMVIGAVALIVIGPKDLPAALRTVGNMVGKVRRMASEFQGQFNEAMREAELDDVKRQIQGVNDSVSSLGTGFNPIQSIRDELKGAIDTKPASSGAAPAASVAADQVPDWSPPAPVEAEPALSLPPLPPITDPAESFAPEPPRETRSAEAEPLGTPTGIRGAEPAGVKLDEKA